MTSLAESVTKTQDDSMINTQDDKMTQDDRMINTQDDKMTQDDRITTLAESIRERYSETGEDEDDSGSGSQGLVFIVSVSSSPQARAGKLPPLLTLIDYNIGKNENLRSLTYLLWILQNQTMKL